MDDAKILKSLIQGYFSVHYIDLETGAYSEVHLDEYMKGMFPTDGDDFLTLIQCLRDITFDAYDKEIKILADIRHTKRVLETEQSFCVECKTKIIGWARISVFAADRDEEGHVRSIVVTGQNIDTEKQDELDFNEQMKNAYDEANRANAAKTEFLARMSHDIRTPLTGILGMASIASANIEDKERVEYCVNRINDSGKHLLALINDIIDVSRIESGRIEIVRDSFSLSALADDVLATVRPLADMKKQMLVFNMGQVNHKLVVGDRARLEEIIVNIACNAIKYTHENGRISIFVAEEELNSLRSDFLITVRDNGSGMRPDFMMKVFEPFAREYTGQKDVDGSGLGLTIAKKYIDAMNGKIEVKSVKGRGSRFIIRIPLEVQENQKEEKAKKELSISDLKLKGKRILLVEDNDLNAEITMELLRGCGLEIERAHDGAEGLEMFTEQPPFYYDLIFMDIQMPVMDGYQSTTGIRSLERGDSVKIPIIAMTANAFASDVRAAKEAGMNDYCTKPLDNKYLAKLLKKYLL